MGWGPNDRELIPNYQLCFPAVREIRTDTLVAGVMSPLRDSVTLATGLCVKFFFLGSEPFSGMCFGLQGIFVTYMDIQLPENGEFCQLTAWRPFSFSNFRILNSFLFYSYFISL